MLIDTHSHIYSEEYNGEADEVVLRAMGAGLGKVILPNVDSSTIKRLIDMSDRFPDFCCPLMGIHPTSVKDDYMDELSVFDYWLSKRKFFGIGEIGIDLYWDKAWFEEQLIVFKHQLNTARKLGLPVSIHVRESFDEVYDIVSKEQDGGLSGIFHAFSGTIEQARLVLAMGFKIGVGGTVTFKNSGIDKLVAQLSPDDIVLETDAPWLAPVPFRGKRNESSNLVYIAEKVASILNVSPEEISRITTENALKVFKLA